MYILGTNTIYCVFLICISLVILIFLILGITLAVYYAQYPLYGLYIAPTVYRKIGKIS